MGSTAARLLQFSDLHLFRETEGEQHGIRTDESVRRVLCHAQAHAWPPDAIVLTGDLAQDESAGAYARCRNIFGELGVAILTLPGNHDTPALMRAMLNDPPFQFCDVYGLGDWDVVLLDSHRPGSAEGYLTESELRRLANTLSDTAAKYVLVCLHHPPMPVGSPWLDRYGLKNAAELLALLARSHKTRAVLSGHVHQEASWQCEHVEIHACPSTCYQFLPRARRFALDGRPPAYRRVDLRADGHIETKVIRVDV